MKKSNLIYILAYILLSFMTLSGGSSLIILSDDIKIIIYLVIFALFSFDIIVSNLTLKRIIIFIFLCLIGTLTYIKTGSIFFLLDIFALMALKNKNIDRIVKVDLFIKIFFLMSHSLLYMLDYFFDFSLIENILILKEEHIRHSLYFVHPNIASSLVFWIIIDIIYLKKKLDFKDIILIAFFMSITYILTRTRTTILLCSILMILFSLKKILKKNTYENFINFIYKYSFDIIAIFSIAMCYMYQNGNPFLNNILNPLTSGRVYFSSIAIKKYGINLLANSSMLSSNWIIVDNFYIACAIRYGFIYVLLLVILAKIKTKKKYTLDKILIVILSISLFSEYNGIIVGNAIPLLLLGNIINNKEKI